MPDKKTSSFIQTQKLQPLAPKGNYKDIYHSIVVCKMTVLK